MIKKNQNLVFHDIHVYYILGFGGVHLYCFNGFLVTVKPANKIFFMETYSKM